MSVQQEGSSHQLKGVAHPLPEDDDDDDDDYGDGRDYCIHNFQAP